MKSYNAAMKRKIVKESVREEMEFYAEHYDLVMLTTLREHFGFGAERLRRFYAKYVELYEDYQRRYYDKNDIEQFGSRTDAYVLKERLKEIGFDYDAEVKNQKGGKE